MEQKCKINVSGVNEIIPHQFFETKRIPGVENSTSKSEERTTSKVDDFHSKESITWLSPAAISRPLVSIVR